MDHIIQDWWRTWSRRAEDVSGVIKELHSIAAAKTGTPHDNKEGTAVSQELSEWLAAMEENEQTNGNSSEPSTVKGSRTITRDEARGWIRAHHHCKKMQQRARLPASKRVRAPGNPTPQKCGGSHGNGSTTPNNSLAYKRKARNGSPTPEKSSAVYGQADRGSGPPYQDTPRKPIRSLSTTLQKEAAKCQIGPTSAPTRSPARSWAEGTVHRDSMGHPMKSTITASSTSRL